MAARKCWACKCGVMAHNGRQYRARAVPARLASHVAHMLEKVPPDTSRLLICPMPGLLVRLHVAAGDRVEPGQPLATVEAMKMENILRAPMAGLIDTVHFGEGDSVATGVVILELANQDEREVAD